MCGIAGFISANCGEAALVRMGDALCHRGPDQTGYYLAGSAGFVSKRLSIIDPENGKQPAFNENRTVIVIYNGEVFNYLQLRRELEAKGHRISNNSDTAVLPHLYEQYGTGMFEKLSGQFAICVYDIKTKRLILARDRMGILPLHYYFKNGAFFFGSEVKAILAAGTVGRELSYEAVCDVFTFWAPQHDRTIFRDIFSVLPGEIVELHNNGLQKRFYYRLQYVVESRPAELEKSKEEIENLLVKAVQSRLVGDVKISAYLSGGLDSSLITSMVARHFDRSVEAFSVVFEDERFDESRYQKLVCDRLGLKRHAVLFRNSEIPGLLRKIIWHTEAPLLRAGPIPLFRLSELVNGSGGKVVLSGEGADELFGGYDIFREVKIRNYLKNHPDSVVARQLFRKVNLFSDSRMRAASAGSLSYFYMHHRGDGLLDSHYARWGQFSFFERFFSDSVKSHIKDMRYPDYLRSLNIDHGGDIGRWTDLQKCQYIEIDTFLSKYLLSSQGDRMAMANSVEVRFPFLDDALVRYCTALSDNLKIRALNEKYILKSIAEKYLPQELINRKKFPYRSPVDAGTLLGDSYMAAILSEDRLRRANLFDAKKVAGFFDRIRAKDTLSERETMLLLGVTTLQVLCDVFSIGS